MDIPYSNLIDYYLYVMLYIDICTMQTMQTLITMLSHEGALGVDNVKKIVTNAFFPRRNIKVTLKIH